MDSTAIDSIAKLAVEAARANLIDIGVPALIIDNDQKIVSLEQFQPERVRFRGRFATSVLGEFVNYVKANPGGAGFVDPTKVNATVFFNLGDTDKPGHGDWTGSLALTPTAAYAAIQAVESKRLAQRELAEWIEDWATNLHAQFGEADEKMSIGQAVAAIRNLTISAKSDVTHNERDFGATRTALEDLQARSEGGIPKYLSFSTEPYPNFVPREIRLRLSVITGEKPALTLRIVGKEALEEDIAREFRQMLLEGIGDAATVTLGSFTP